MASSLLEEAIENYLRKQATLVKWIQSKIYWLDSPASVGYPYVTYKTIAGDAIDPRIGENSQKNAIIQFDAWGKDKLKILKALNAIVDLIKDYTGSMDGVNVFYVNCGIVRPVHEPESGVFHFMLDTDWTYKE